jgi:hypothetical protein
MASNASTSKDKDGKETNMEVDYVICYRFAATGKPLTFGFRELLLTQRRESRSGCEL